MIERKFHKNISFDKVRLHSSERNKPWNTLFELFKINLKDSDIRYYPNLDKTYSKCRKFFKCKNLILGLGSDRCVKYFFEANQEYKKVVTTAPSFPMYKVYSDMLNYEYVGVEYEDLLFPEEEFLNAITEDSVVVLSNPNTPIAHNISFDFIRRILSKKVPTLIDEAYIEFSDMPSCAHLIKDFPNLYVTRTFSKALGSAGVRAGVLLSNKKNIEKVTQYRDMYELSGPTVKWMNIVMDNYHYIQNYIDKVKETKKDIKKVLDTKNITYIDSKSNWLHIKEPFEVPDKIVVRKNCILPGSEYTWTRMSICSSVNFEWLNKL